MPLISVIVPVYKVEKYLERCVDSILCQSLADFELWLVDDGSPDACPAICDSYAGKDGRV
ncbi:MAG: glycosyltransferase, partial [Clostridia bacterium]|nr:glycosyltransferase [Clostridia bacterium]